MSKVPNLILTQLRCKHCRCFLSCGPVYVLPQGSSLCGRCEDVAIKQYRHTAFEVLASYFHYPCQYYYYHCPEYLQWNECIQHEDDCGYQNFCNRLCTHPMTLFKSEKKLDMNEEVRCVYLPNEILRRLTCSICGHHLSYSPVYVRPDGTSLCYRCIASNGPPSDAIRHTAFETLADIVLFPCMHRVKGCPQFLKFGSDVVAHEAQCSYGIVYRPNSKRVTKGQKERGVIETATGHVYGTITPNRMQLFSHQDKTTKKNEDTDEFVNALRKQQQRFSVAKTNGVTSNGDVRSNGMSTPSSAGTRNNQEEFNFGRPSNLEAPKADPHKLSRANSNIQTDISEAKIRHRLQQKGSEANDDTDSHSSKSREATPKICSNLDDIFWVYDEVINEYKNRKTSVNHSNET